MEMGLVRQAMAYRVKYRVSVGKRTISLFRLGVHKQNRGGMYPQPDIVRNLGLKVLATGFNESEANHEGVCVEYVPLHERFVELQSRLASCPQSRFESCLEYNIKACDHPFLIKCFNAQSDAMYGTLPHSHLLLVLLSLANGADWKVDDEPNMSKFLHPDGSFNPTAVAAYDTELGRVLKDGLMMEVLRWKMLSEEPTAASLISQALNTAQNFALRTSELTALKVLLSLIHISEPTRPY